MYLSKKWEVEKDHEKDSGKWEKTKDTGATRLAPHAAGSHKRRAIPEIR